MIMTLVLLCSLLFMFVGLGRGCTCVPRLLQQHYCHSDFVLRVSPFQEVVEGSPPYKVYTVSIIQTYKLSPEAEVAFSGRKLYTPEQGSLCGINLVKGEDYLVAGNVLDGKIKVHLCDFAFPWNSLSLYQQNAVQLGIYMQSCSCKVCGFFDGCGDNEIPKKGCRLNQRQDRANCYNQFSSCRMLRLNSCAWEMSTSLKACLKPPTGTP